MSKLFNLNGGRDGPTPCGRSHRRAYARGEKLDAGDNVRVASFETFTKGDDMLNRNDSLYFSS